MILLWCVTFILLTTRNGVIGQNIPCYKDLEVLKNGFATLQKAMEQMKTHYDTRLSILQTKIYELQNELHRKQNGRADLTFDTNRKQNGMVYLQNEASNQQEVSVDFPFREFGDKELININVGAKYNGTIHKPSYNIRNLQKNGTARIFGGNEQEELRKMVVQQNANQRGSSARKIIRHLNTASKTKKQIIMEKDTSKSKITEHNRYGKIGGLAKSQESRRRKSKRQTDPVGITIAFSARSDTVRNIALGEHVIFENVITNVGNMYNSRTGNFHCEVPGIYVFFVTVYSISGRFVTTEITKNGISLSYVASPSLSNFIGPASNMVVIDLQKGDTVWVRSAGLYSGSVMDNWSTFSGFLLN